MFTNGKMHASVCFFSYRKVASDKCEGGDLIDRYKPTTINCPKLAPANLHLSLAGESIVGVGDTVEFELSQFEVSLHTSRSSCKSALRAVLAVPCAFLFIVLVNS